MGDFNLNEYVIQIQDVEPQILIGMYDKAMDEYNEVRQKISKSMNLVTESRDRLINDIKSLYQ